MTRVYDILIPAHDEAGAIADVVRRCLAVGPREVLVVDDGSRDATAHRARHAGARVVSLPHNLGKGGAIARGLATLAPGSDAVVLLDGDGQDAPEEIPLLLAALDADAGIDLAIGSRFLGSFEPRAITRLNRAGTLALTATLNALFAAKVTDPIAGFRAFRSRAIDGIDVSARRYDVEVDMLLAVLRRGGRVVEVPVTRSPRAAGASKLHSFRDGARILRRILAHRVAASR